VQARRGDHHRRQQIPHLVYRLKVLAIYIEDHSYLETHQPVCA
jgi:hypothetical protein